MKIVHQSSSLVFFFHQDYLMLRFFFAMNFYFLTFEILIYDFIFCRNEAHGNSILIIFRNSLSKCFVERCTISVNTLDFRALFML